MLKISKNNGIALFHLGNIEILSGNRARGIELFNNAIANGFDDAQVYFSLGLMHEEADSDELAIRNYSKAILKDSNRADIRIRKVRLLIKNNLLPEALQTIDELILSNPDVFEGYHLKFLVLVSQEKYDDAENVINDAMKLFPKDAAFALDKASLMITRKEYDAALKYLDSIKCDMETDQDIRHSIAMEKSRIYAYQQKMDMAISALEEAKAILIEKNEFDIEATYLLMNCYLNNEDFEKVINAAKELKKVQGEDYYVLAAYYYEPFALKQMGKLDEANNLFEESVSYFRGESLKYPNNVDSYAFRIMSLRELGKLEKALELSDYLVNVNDKLPEAHILRATVLEALEDNKKEETDMAQIRITPEELRNGADFLEQKLEAINAEVAALKGKIDEVTGNWEGAAQSSFVETFENDMYPILKDTLPEVITGIVAQMDGAADAIEQTDAEVVLDVLLRSQAI